MTRRRQFLRGFALYVAVVGGLVTWCGWVETPAPCDAAVVLGNRVEPDGTPSVQLEGRLEAALEAWRAKLVPVVIVSGGFGAEGHDEAVVMGHWLEAHGVPRARIVVDSGGYDTFQTARFAGRWAAEHDAKRVLVISQWYHLYRCQHALWRFGIGEVHRMRSRRYGLRDVYGFFREVLGMPVYWLRPYR